jgi:RNA polymerase sigma factor (sigma-70 family)
VESEHPILSPTDPPRSALSAGPTSRQDALAALRERRSALGPEEIALFRAEAFPTIFRAHHARVRGALRKRGGRPAVLEELTQEVFFRFFFHVVQEGFPDSITAKLLGLATGLALNHRRRERRNPVGLGPPSSTAEEPKSGPEAERRMDLRRTAQRLLPALSQQDRDLIQAVVLDEQSHDEVAAQLGVARRTLTSRVAAAKQRLAAMAMLLLPESQRGL